MFDNKSPLTFVYMIQNTVYYGSLVDESENNYSYEVLLYLTQNNKTKVYFGVLNQNHPIKNYLIDLNNGYISRCREIDEDSVNHLIETNNEFLLDKLRTTNPELFEGRNIKSLVKNN